MAEGPHTGTITHSASGGGFNWVSISSVTANITDNDTANPDLVMSRLSGTEKAVRGRTISVNNTVTNSSSVSSGSFSVGIYLSRDKVITNSDIFLGDRYVAGLAAGGSSTGLL
jgi:hypothetical protein